MHTLKLCNIYAITVSLVSVKVAESGNFRARRDLIVNAGQTLRSYSSAFWYLHL